MREHWSPMAGAGAACARIGAAMGAASYGKAFCPIYHGHGAGAVAGPPP